MRRLVVLFGLLLVLPHAHALFSYEQPKIAEEPWDHLPIKVYIDNVNTPPMWVDTYEYAATSALKYWEKEGAKRLSYKPMFQQVSTPEEADITIRWVENIGEEGEFPRGVAGYARIQQYTVGEKVRFEHVDIVLEVAEKRGLLWWAHGKKTANLVCMHELGHALGLDHTTKMGDVMNPTFVEMHEPNPQMLAYVGAASPFIVLVVVVFGGYFFSKYLKARNKRRRLESDLFEEPITLQYKKKRR
ncbi:MAG: matrixin family metalloprotease [Methermicoccaceae archaeon]